MSRWGFVVSAVKNKLSGNKATYGARIRHLDVIRGERLYKEIAQYLAINPVLAENLVNGIGGFIEEKLQYGYKLDFGVFKVGLTIRGGFDAANDAFKPERNSVCVALSPGMRLKKSVAKLLPENVTRRVNPVINCVYCVNEGSEKSVIVCHEVCAANGVFPNVDFKGDGDGVWLATSTGVRVADAKILSASATRIDFVIETDVPSGDYKLVVGCHDVAGVSVMTGEILVKVSASA